MTLTSNQGSAEPAPSNRANDTAPPTPITKSKSTALKSLTGSQPTDQALAGFLAGFTSTIILHPFDLIKTRFQLRSDPPKSPVDVLHRQRPRNNWDAIRALYRGLGTNATASMMSWGLYFWAYQHCKDWALRWRQPFSTENVRLTFWDHMISSTAAGFGVCLVANPLWLLKTRMCALPAHHPDAHRNGFAALKSLVAKEGILALWKGLTPALLGVSHGSVQFVVYEEIKRWKPPPASTLNDVGQMKQHSASAAVQYLTSAAVSKIVATLVTYPYQTLRARIQNDRKGRGERSLAGYDGVVATTRVIWQREGARGFYKGLATNLIRVLPGTCITFGVYESLVSSFTK
ncbi:hypothetical protein CXG81DRAFT_16223 [Caulochytrium protostelioides]|uniref:Mitochondrial carrier n=1 Tax=Caulochytrium protostelioides TaxID=1555241 RepID=A0A4P9WXL5_9FUNG|nr:mitochondrial carrier [Caulochytrium protostelioides]RKO98219.1 hypothetical protein CXG81DRAFT_16223 [Caulochytrium protostelioides]|eukprot:RKO98219.1 hypothetical protein CXG81DRAFT_16223 [Caulochytrium protostelioides]